jgi:hypothetical protein
MKVGWALALLAALGTFVGGARVALANYVDDTDGMAPCYVAGLMIVINKLAYSPIVGNGVKRGDAVVAITPRLTTLSTLG